MQKVLTEMNVQIANVISDISGLTGMAILDAILEGERNRYKLAELPIRVPASTEEIAKSLRELAPELPFYGRSGTFIGSITNGSENVMRPSRRT
jgi:hypothetical protein